MTNHAILARLRARRVALAAQLQAEAAQYNELEETLKQLDRQSCATQGRLRELDELIAELTRQVEQEP